MPRSSRLLLGGLVLLAQASRGLARDDGVRPQMLDPEQIVERLSGAGWTRRDTDRAWHDIERLRQREWDVTLRRLVMLAQEQHAVIATNMLIHAGAPTLETLIADHIVDWSDENQRCVLQAITLAERLDELRAVPRRVLRDLVRRAGVIDATDLGCTAADVAALQIAQTADPADVALLRTAIGMRPRTRGLWLALSVTGGIGREECGLALALLVDPTVPELVRMPAAVAVAPHLEVAADFVHRRVRSILVRFECWTLEQLFHELPGDHDPSDGAWTELDIDGDLDRERRRAFHEGLRVLALLHYLKTDGARSLVAVALASGNQAIRQIGSVVAAHRWPHLLLEQSPGRLDKHELAAALALVAHHHPLLTGRVETGAAADALAVARERLEQHGEIMAFEWAGPLVAGW